MTTPTNETETVRPGASAAENADDVLDTTGALIERVYEPGRGPVAREADRKYLAKFGLDVLPPPSSVRGFWKVAS